MLWFSAGTLTVISQGHSPIDLFLSGLLLPTTLVRVCFSDFSILGYYLNDMEDRITDQRKHFTVGKRAKK